MEPDLYVDESYLLALIDDDESIPISDEKFAVELQLQEALFNSSSLSSKVKQEKQSTPLRRPKTEEREKQSNPKRIKLEFGDSSSEKKPTFCGICMDFKQNPENFNGLSKCKHQFCVDCIVNYIGSKINEKIVKVECPDPNCNRVIEPEDCGSVLPKDVFGRWENALFEASISGCRKFYCPFKDCSVLMVDDGEEKVVGQSECPDCHRLFCASCRVGWHVGFTCEEFQSLGEEMRENEV